MSTFATAIPVSTNEDVLTIPALRDTVLRTNIQRTLANYGTSLSDEKFQFLLSKLLCNVECTDTGNAIRFAARYGAKFHYVPEPDKWYVYNGSRWVQDTEHELTACAKQVAAYLDMEADCLPLPVDRAGNPLICPSVNVLQEVTPEQKAVIAQFDAYEKAGNALRKWGTQSRGKVKIEAMIYLLKSEPGITVAKARFDADKHLLNCRNGVLDLNTGNLDFHTPKLLMTRIAAVDFNPGMTCPSWDSFMNKVMKGRPALVEFIQKLAGMGLSGERHEDLFTVFHGNGSNGKTVFQEVLRDMLGEYADIAPSEMFLEKKSEGGYNDIAGLDGVRFLFKDETKQGRRLDEATVKELSGGGAKKARFLFKEFFVFVPQFTSVLSTNHKPVITGNDNGIWRRVKLVPWEHNFDNDPERKSKADVLTAFKKEYPGILNWCYIGLLMVNADMQKYGKLQIPSEIEDATNSYRETSDVIGNFIAERCVAATLERVTVANLYSSYRIFMDESGCHPLNKVNFGEGIQGRGYEKVRGTGGTWVWAGLRLKNVDAAYTSDTPPPVDEHIEISEEELAAFGPKRR